MKPLLVWIAVQSVFLSDIKNRIAVPMGYRPPGEVCQDLARASAPMEGNIAVRFRGRNDAGGERQSHRLKSRGLSADSGGEAPSPSESPLDSFAARRDESVIMGYTL